MVTGSKKPKANAKAAPKKASKAKTTASRPKAAAKPKDNGAKAKTVKKTAAAVKAAEARKVGEMVYNDELLESLSEAVLLAEAEMAAQLPAIKDQLFDYDIYFVSQLTDEDIAGIAKDIAKESGVAEDAAMAKLAAIRDNARVFVNIAETHYSVRAFIDGMIAAEGREKLKGTLVSGKFCLKDVGPETCESFLLLF
jgi:hypothetical protein